ncbi:hypothetical protein ABVT39_005906 [Epinephelus coioides]
MLEAMVDESVTLPQTDPWKRKRDSNTELLEYLERADERFLQHIKDLNDALLQKLETDTSVFLGLMGRMVSVMEAQAFLYLNKFLSKETRLLLYVFT